MVKCKDCKYLENKDDGRVRYMWCPLIGDNPDLELERSCLMHKSMTNADRIRKMTVEELADFLLSDDYYIDCTTCKEPENEYGFCIGKCENELVRWLKSEARCEQ